MAQGLAYRVTDDGNPFETPERPKRIVNKNDKAKNRNKNKAAKNRAIKIIGIVYL